MLILLLLLLYAQTFSADNRALLSSSFSHNPAVLSTPEDYINQLEYNLATLSKNNVEDNHTFVLDINSSQKINEDIINHIFAPLNSHRSYFIALAQSSLPDSEKIKKKYVSIPPINQIEKQTTIANIYQNIPCYLFKNEYPFIRLIFAGLIHTCKNKNLENKGYFLAHQVMLYDDTSLLTKIVHQKSFDPSLYSMAFSAARSIQAAEILMNKDVKFRMSIDMQHPIIAACSLINKRPIELINWFLTHIKPLEKNKLYLEKITNYWNHQTSSNIEKKQ